MTTTASSVEYEANEHWSETERRNVELIAEFIRLAMNTHDYDELRSRFGGGAYRQHSRGLPEGIDGLADYLESFTRRFPEYQYDVKRVSVDGEFVTFHSHATTRAKHRGNERKGFNIIDTWQVVDGEITEHWDAIQALDFPMRLFVLLAGGRSRNSNSIF